MSRCFPFPPPGYEGKPRSEHKDLLKKEKHKPKKHKKERTDGGKREGKEKDRDHRKDKHKKKKKKNKREKHEDRRKRKERDKEKQNLEQETQRNDDLDNRRPKQIVHNESAKNSKHRDELASQITGQEGHANNTGSSTGKLLPQSVKSFGLVGSEEKERSSVSRVSEKSGKIGQHNHAGEKEKDKTRALNGTNLQVGAAENPSTHIHGGNGVGLQQESSKGVIATTAATQRKHMIIPSANAAQRTKQADQHSDVSSHSAYTKSDSMSNKQMTEKKNGGTNNFHSRMDKQIVRGKNGEDQGNARIKEVKAKHQKGVKDGARGHVVKKRKARDGNERKVREKRRVGHEQKRKELDGHGTRKNHIHEMDSAHLNGNKFTSDDVKKRKDLNAKSSLHEHSMRMTKMPRTSPVNHLRVNRETLKHFEGTAPSSKLPVDTNPCVVDMLQDNKECYNNGIAGPNYPEEHKSSVSSSSYVSSQLSLTPPHPDTKYMSQVYSIPAVDDCSGYIDQDWLFPGDRTHQKSRALEAAEPPQVWSEAQPIETADVVAMPYVVQL
ncbi:unnamed protein product [Alopecurus aequalis]